MYISFAEDSESHSMQDDRLASHVTIFFPDPFVHNPNSPSEPTYSTTELQGEEGEAII